MANVSIPQLPPTVALTGGEPLEIVQSGVSQQCSISQIVLLAVALIKYGYPSANVCTNRQMRAALAAGNNLVTIDNATSADIDNAVTIQWRNGVFIVQGDTLYVFIQTTLGYTSGQMTTLFGSAQSYPL